MRTPEEIQADIDHINALFQPTSQDALREHMKNLLAGRTKEFETEKVIVISTPSRPTSSVERLMREPKLAPGWTME